jgi:Phage tail tube protein
MSAEITTIARLAISSATTGGSTPGAGNLLLNFGSFDKGVRDVIANANMMRGEYSQRINRIRNAKRNAGGTLEMAPTAVEFARIFDWALGTAANSVTYALGNDCREAALYYDDKTTVWLYAEAAVNTLSLRSSDGDQSLHASIGFISKDCVSGATFPSGLASSVVDETTQPFVHSDTTQSGASNVVVNSVNTTVQSIEVDLNNHINPERFFNSPTLTAFVKEDRTLTLKLSYPFGDFPSLYAAAAAENVGVPVTITYTIGNTSLLMTFPQVLFPREPVTIPLKKEVVHQISGICLRTDSSESLVVTLDDTP